MNSTDCIFIGNVDIARLSVVIQGFGILYFCILFFFCSKAVRVVQIRGQKLHKYFRNGTDRICRVTLKITDRRTSRTTAPVTRWMQSPHSSESSTAMGKILSTHREDGKMLPGGKAGFAHLWVGSRQTVLKCPCNEFILEPK